ncbi:MAG: cold-shock protein [Pseudomonadota bacterium]
MTKGTVKWFDSTKGFGFIQPEDGEKDVFVHKSALEAARIDGLADGQDVAFDIETDGDGRRFVANMTLA